MTSKRWLNNSAPALLIAATIFSAAFVSGSCTEAELEPIPSPPIYRDDKLRVSGGLCTREPETLVFPLRVLFVVDSSVSMEVSDPPDPATGITGRERAVRETWTDLLDQGPEGVKFGIIRFSAQAQSQTPTDLDADGLPDTYYSADRTILDFGTAALGTTDRTTNYVNALGEAYFEMRTELQNAELESLPLSKYIVVFLSDGEPDTDQSDARQNSRQEILEQVGQLQELADTFRVGTFEFHTAFLSSGQIAADESAKELLQDMAEVGNGNFRSFPSGEELNFLFIDFTVLRRVFTLRTFGAVNLNAVMDLNQIPPPAPPVVPDMGSAPDMTADMGTPDMAMPDPDGLALAPNINPWQYVDVNGNGMLECGEPLADTDGDGLADVQEIRERSNPFLRDTDDDGLSDYLEWQLRDDGLDLLDPTDSQCYIPNPCIDSNMDGNCDCVLDANADGVCDCVVDPENQCVQGDLDCIDEDMDGFCDCPDLDGDGFCDYEDSDGDSLHDCEEIFYGTAQNGSDTDADGIPDSVEVKFQSNPAEADNLGDLDSDSTLNGVEILANTNPICEDTTVRSRVAYRYNLEERGLFGAKTCYEFGVSNITLVPTLETPDGDYPGNGWNRILFYAGEVAFDDPNAFALYRVACVMASYNPDGNFKNPPSGQVNLTEADFVEVDEFDPDIHCKIP